MKTVNVLITGAPRSGKSRVLSLIKDLLREDGFDVVYTPNFDHASEKDFDNAMKSNYRQAIDAIKQNRKIVLTEHQTTRLPHEASF
jgi:hypothetical protein